MLDEQTKQQIKELFSRMEDSVELVFFSKQNCNYCGEIKNLLEELSSLTDKLKVSFYSFEENGEAVKAYNADDAPLIIIKGKNKGELRFYGIPAGHEFGPFLLTLIDASLGDTQEVGEDIKEEIKSLENDITFKVFVTPTCPYCPRAVRLAYTFALLNPNSKAYVYEAIEFPDLATRYNVRGVPKTVINETLQLEGAYPPDIVLKKIKEL